MSSGRVHAEAAGLMMIPISGAALWLWQQGYDAAPWLVVGGICGWLITPDLDLEGRTHEEQRMWELFPPLGYLWQVMWYPYALLFVHRGVSHWPLFGTLSRIATFSLMSTVLIVVANYGYNLWAPGVQLCDPLIVWKWLTSNQKSGLTLYVAMAIQDSVHFVFDIVSTSRKRAMHRLMRKQGRYRGGWTD